MRSPGNPTEAGHVEDVNPLICIRGSASPGHSYTMTPLHVKNAGNAPMEVTFTVNPADATTWLKIPAVTIPAGQSAGIPLTLVVPPNAPSGQDTVLLTLAGSHFDVRFSVGTSPPPACLAAGYTPLPGTNPLVFLWLLVLLVIVPGAFWIRRRLTRGV
jgi:hypothetical protein